MLLLHFKGNTLSSHKHILLTKQPSTSKNGNIAEHSHIYRNPSISSFPCDKHALKVTEKR